MAHSHPTVIEGYDSLEKLAQDVVNLDHTARLQFLQAFEKALRREACGDLRSGRPVLGNLGLSLANGIRAILEISAKIAKLTIKNTS